VISPARRTLIISCITIATAGAGVASLTAAQAAPQPAAAITQAASGDTPPSAVEDFQYPGAEKILETKKIKLLRGDGHILLADCNNAVAQIKVMTNAVDPSGSAGTICFQANAKTGYLTLEIPRVFYLETSDHAITAAITAAGKTQTVAVPTDSFAPVGEGNPGGPHSVLVELRVTG
jgi:hypothetical protein